MASSRQSNCISSIIVNAGNVPPASMQATGRPSPLAAYKHLPGHPFTPDPFKGNSMSNCLPAQPTYLCFPGQLPINRPPPPTNPPSTSKRSLPFDENLMSHSFLADSHPFAFGPIITAPQGAFLNPAFRAGPSAYSAVNQSFANIQAGMPPRPMPVSMHLLPRPPHVQPSYMHQVHPVSMSGRQPVKGAYAKAISGNAKAHDLMDAAHPDTPEVYAHYSVASCSNSTATLGTKAIGSKTHFTSKPSSQVAARAAGDKQDHPSDLQADRLSSWCHVKHSKGEMPNLSKDTVKSLVQVLSHAAQLMQLCLCSIAHVCSCQTGRLQCDQLHAHVATRLFLCD